MKQVTRDEWIKALRSGRYKKGEDALRSRTKEGLNYCCLGVVCNLSDPRWSEKLGPKAQPVNKSLLFEDDVTGYVKPSKRLTREVQSDLATVNDYSDSFEPVIKKILEIFPRNVIIIPGDKK